VLNSEESDLQERVMKVIVERLATGERLPPEKKLATELGVSRSALREVLRAFEVSGIVVAQQGSGRYVQLPDVSASITGGWNILIRTQPDLLHQLLDIRLVLEERFLESAIERLEIRELQQLRDLADRMYAKACQGDVFVDEDKEFHRILFSRTENILLEQLLKAFWDLFEQLEDLSLKRSDDLLHGAVLHQDLFKAILTKDVVLAKKLLADQFEDVRGRLNRPKT
jgi:DNA-binding FadR family transcriptional regulator